MHEHMLAVILQILSFDPGLGWRIYPPFFVRFEVQFQRGVVHIVLDVWLELHTTTVI